MSVSFTVTINCQLLKRHSRFHSNAMPMPYSKEHCSSSTSWSGPWSMELRDHVPFPYINYIYIITTKNTQRYPTIPTDLQNQTPSPKLELTNRHGLHICNDLHGAGRPTSGSPKRTKRSPASDPLLGSRGERAQGALPEEEGMEKGDHGGVDTGKTEWVKRVGGVWSLV